MKFLISGYGTKTGLDDKSFKTLRLSSNGRHRIEAECISHRGKNLQDAVAIECSTRKVHKGSSDNDVKLFIHSVTKEEAYSLAERLIALAEFKDSKEKSSMKVRRSPSRRAFLHKVLGSSLPPNFGKVSIDDVQSIVDVLEADIEMNCLDEEDLNDVALQNRLLARRRLLKEFMKTYDEEMDFTPGPRSLK